MNNNFIGEIFYVDQNKIKFTSNEYTVGKYILSNNKIFKNSGLDTIYKVISDSEDIICRSYEEIKTNNEIYITAYVIGYIKNGIFNSSIMINPNLKAKVYNLEPIDYEIIYGKSNKNNKKIKIGYIETGETIDIDPNLLVNSHNAIYGKTGSGKTNTMYNLINNLIDHSLSFKSSPFMMFLFDINTESNNLEKSYLENKNCIFLKFGSNLKLDFNFDSLSFLENIFSITEITQKPFLMSIINKVINNPDMLPNKKIFNELKYIHDGSTGEGGYARFKSALYSIENLHHKLISINKDLEIIKIISDILNFTKKLHIARGSYKNIDNFDRIFNESEFLEKVNIDKITNFDLFTILLAINPNNDDYQRMHIQNVIKQILSRYIMFNELFNLKNADTFSVNFFEQIFNNFDYSSKNNNNFKFVVFELSNFDTVIQKGIIDSIINKIYRRSETNFFKNTNNPKICLFLDEVHNFYDKNEIDNIFEKIAKEGRKLKIFLTHATQRPSEFSKTVISQSTNFFIHKIVNKEDFNSIKSFLLSNNDEDFLKIANFGIGEAMIIGDVVKNNLVIKVDLPTYGPKNISENTW